MLDAYQDNRTSRTLLWVFSGMVLLFLMLPTLIVAPLSFSASDLLEFPPRQWSLRWYETFFSSPAWMAALRTSLILGVLTAAIAVPLSFLACFAINRLGSRSAAGVYALLLLPSVTPGILLAIGLFFVLAKLGLVGTLTGVLAGHIVLAIPVSVIVLHPALNRFDWAQAQAARSLGASWFRTMRDVILPQLGLSLTTAALMAFLTSLDEAVISIFVANGPNSTLPKLMFISLRDQIDPTIAAISTLWTVLISGVVLFINLRDRGQTA
ncbi:putative spermidine/putrescine transport system permease protein [Rhizobium sp. SG_E_25_P2]|jgi:putative spermidine/putrescine transport system permease protein|uniref:ABC transporter permease n=1 Tax=Rhizobium sp. SG_E_25_P2 TaxID=2879942 RepID=UPI002475DF5E|nr:ABC transporter permease [Rhizobium sp. SG_E_25_P2]MDH6266099.1 putative spermidine/putrescine transport system permease protein [Rhizobium sp. SG_E_25_P2]